MSFDRAALENQVPLVSNAQFIAGMDRRPGLHRETATDFKTEKFNVLVRHGGTSVNLSAPVGFRGTVLLHVGDTGVLVNVIAPVGGLCYGATLGTLP